MANFNVQIKMNEETVTKLKNAGFKLFGFKAVSVSLAGGLPLVWFKSENFLSNTNVRWEEQFKGYISSQTRPAAGTVIYASCVNKTVDLGQTMVVDDVGTCSETTTKGTKGAISILNNGSHEWTCGINQIVNGKPQALCAIPLYGKNLDVVTPVQKVFFMFATSPVEVGTVIIQSFSSGALIDLTGVESREVEYDINKGWLPTTATWMQLKAAQTDLTPMLINQG
jgi:hypothetical protein